MKSRAQMDFNWRKVADISENHFPDIKEDIESADISKNHAYGGGLRAELSGLQKECKTLLHVHV